MSKLKISLALSIFYFLAPYSGAVSFDCKKASTSVEMKICSSQELGDLDTALSVAYNQSKLTSDAEVLKSQQIAWIKQRNQCNDFKCIEGLYKARIEFLLNSITPTNTQLTQKAPAANKITVQNSEKPPLSMVGDFNEFRPQYKTTKIIDGKFYFSQYAKSGNNYDVLSIDIKSQSVQYVAREYPDAIFVAENEKYAIIQTQGTVVRPLVVIGKTIGKEVAKLKITSKIIWAKIVENKLTVIQSGTAKNLITFSLPDLEIINIADIEASEDLSTWNNNLVILGRGKVNVFDENFKLKSSIQLKNETAIKGNSCKSSPLHVVGDKAVLITDCGKIQIYDLKAEKWDRTIPAYDAFYSLAAYGNDFLLTAAATKGSTDKMRVYNVANGKEVAIIPIKGSYLFSYDNYLLSLDFHSSKISPITIYTINKAPISSGSYYSNKLISECQKAADIAKSGDIYKAIDLCESAGIKGAIRNGDVVVGLAEYIKLYGIWLSNTYAGAIDALSILEPLIDKESDLIKPRIIEAKLKARYLPTEESEYSTSAQANANVLSYDSPISDDEAKTEFGKVLASVGPTTKTVNIDFGAFSNLFYFDQDKVYIGKWEKQVTLQVYDRETFSFQKTIVIEASSNDETQPSIGSITSDLRSIFLSVHRRWSDDSNIDFVKIDKTTLEIINKSTIGALSLFAYQDKLYSCNCESYGEYYGECSSIDQETFAFSLEPGWLCMSQGTADIASLAQNLSEKRQASKDSYHVVKTGQGDLSDSLVIPEYPKVINTTFAKGTLSKISIKKEANIEERTLMDLRHNPNSAPTLYLYKNDLFIGNGRDLIVYDVGEYRLKKYLKNFISDEMDGNCCGVDQNKIRRFLVDHGRLIVITFNGKNSKIVNLDSR